MAHILTLFSLGNLALTNIYIYIYIYIYLEYTKAMSEMKLDTERTMKREQLYKVGSEFELNSWPDS